MKSSHLVCILSIALLLGSGIGVACTILTDSEDVSAATGAVYPSVTYGSYSLKSSTSNSKTYTITAYSAYKVPEKSNFTYTVSNYSNYVTVTYTPASDRSTATVTITWSNPSYVGNVYFTVGCVVKLDIHPTVTYGTYKLTSTTSTSKTYTITANYGYKVPKAENFSYSKSSDSITATVTYSPSSDRSTATVTVTYDSFDSGDINFTVECTDEVVKSYVTNGTCTLTSSTSTSKTYTITANSGCAVPDNFSYNVDRKYSSVTVKYKPASDRLTATVTIDWSNSHYLDDVSFTVNCINIAQEKTKLDDAKKEIDAMMVLGVLIPIGLLILARRK